MSKGGFLVRFDNKEEFRCYNILLDHDDYIFKVNDGDIKPIPAGIKEVSIQFE